MSTVTKMIVSLRRRNNQALLLIRLMKVTAVLAPLLAPLIPLPLLSLRRPPLPMRMTTNKRDKHSLEAQASI